MYTKAVRNKLFQKKKIKTIICNIFTVVNNNKILFEYDSIE
jgi:hypothetical protein